MPDTPVNRYNTYFGFFAIGVVVFILSLFAGWLETLYAVFFFLAGVNLLFTTTQPQTDPARSTVTHYEVYSRENMVNYILAAVLIIEALIYFALPISKPIVILALWGFNIYAYPRFMDYFSTRLGKRLVTSYLHEQIPELSAQQINSSVAELNADPNTRASAIAEEFQYSTELAERLIVLYNKYLERTQA